MWRRYTATEQVRRFEALQGHLRRAMLLRKRLQLATHASMALDRAAAPVVVLSADRRILLANPAAERLLAASSRPLVEFGCLRPIDAQQTAALESAVKAATALAIDKRTGGVVRLSGPVGKGIVARVVPPPSNLPKRQLAAAVVFLSRESSTLLDPADMMAVLYRLSPAETALVRALCEGSTPEEYSAQRAVTMATIKTQLQSVFHKTNVRRQTDLIRLANSIGLSLGCGCVNVGLLALAENPRSLDAVAEHGDDDFTLGDMLPADAAQDPSGVTQSHEVGRLIDSWIEVLSGPEREILSGRCGLHDSDPETLETLSDRLGLTRERVRQIQNEALLKLRRQMARKGIGKEALL